MDTLDHAVAKACGQSKRCEVDLQKVAGGDWDYLVDCGETVSPSKISAAVGFSVPEPREFTRRDIFVRGWKVVRYDQHPENAERPNYREVYFDDGSNAEKCLRIDRAASRLTVEWKTLGDGEEFYLVVVPAETAPSGGTVLPGRTH